MNPNNQWVQPILASAGHTTFKKFLLVDYTTLVTRIIAGQAKGRRLEVPPGGGTRPMLDQVREALFNSLLSYLDFADARVLDLFAGSGAIGLEALSRGAAHVTSVDSAHVAISTIRRNAAVVNLPHFDIRQCEIKQLTRSTPPQPYDLVFADPPFALDNSTLSHYLTGLYHAGWYSPEALIILERPTHSEQWAWPEWSVPVKHRRYGQIDLCYGQVRAQE